MLKKADLENFTCEIAYHASLSAYTFTRVGGPADVLAFPRTFDELSRLTTLAGQTGTPVTVLGNASNLIVRDGGIRGLVLMLDRLDRVNVAGFAIEAQAGAKLSAVARIAQKHALTGLAFACGIPGSIGGAVYMNAGAYGGEMSHVVSSVKVLDAVTGATSVLTADEMGFGYRRSRIRGSRLIVLSAKLELAPGDPRQIGHEMARLDALRASKQPLEYPSCGSVFKRPAGYFAGKLITDAGCKGHRIGGVAVSDKHAGFMVNLGGATANDYEALIAYVIARVEAHAGVRLEPEVRIIGEALSQA